MLSPVRFSGVRIVKCYPEIGKYQYYRFQVGPDIPRGISYQGHIRNSDTANMLDLIAKRGEMGETRLGDDYATPLMDLLEGKLVTDAERPRITDFITGIAGKSSLPHLEQETLVAGMQANSLSERQKQTFWKLLIVQLLQDASMLPKEKEKLLNAIRLGGERLQGAGMEAGQIRLEGKLRIEGMVLVNGQLEDVWMISRSGGKEGVSLGVWA